MPSIVCLMVATACGEAPPDLVDPPAVVEGIIAAQAGHLREQLARVSRLRDSVAEARAASPSVDTETRGAVDAAMARYEQLAADVAAFPRGKEGDALSEAEGLRARLGELDAELARLRRRLMG